MSQRAATISTMVLFLVSGLSASEKRMSRADLPPQVQRAFAEQTKGADQVKFSQETEQGKVLYEAETRTAGHSKDIVVDASGNVVEIEEQVALDALPSGVKAGLERRADGGKLVRAESLTKAGKLVAYEAIVNKNGKNSEIQVGPKGEQLAHPE